MRAHARVPFLSVSLHECVVMTGVRITIEFGPSSLVASYRISLPGARVFTSVSIVAIAHVDRHVCTEDGATMPVIISRYRYITRSAGETRLASFIGLICLPEEEEECSSSSRQSRQNSGPSPKRSLALITT